MENKKLTMREMICYGIGDITANVYLHRVLHRCAGYLRHPGRPDFHGKPGL